MARNKPFLIVTVAMAVVLVVVAYFVVTSIERQRSEERQRQEEARKEAERNAEMQPQIDWIKAHLDGEKSGIRVNVTTRALMMNGSFETSSGWYVLKSTATVNDPCDWAITTFHIVDGSQSTDACRVSLHGLPASAIKTVVKKPGMWVNSPEDGVQATGSGDMYFEITGNAVQCDTGGLKNTVKVHYHNADDLKDATASLAALLHQYCAAAADVVAPDNSDSAQSEDVSERSTWIDTKTGLMWAKEDNGSDLKWKQASDYCADLRLAGYSNWRLPTIDELEGIYYETKLFGSGYIPATEEQNKRPIRLGNCCAWSSTQSNVSGMAFILLFNSGVCAPHTVNAPYATTGCRTSLGFGLRSRALCVRRSSSTASTLKPSSATIAASSETLEPASTTKVARDERMERYLFSLEESLKVFARNPKCHVENTKDGDVLVVEEEDANESMVKAEWSELGRSGKFSKIVVTNGKKTWERQPD